MFRLNNNRSDRLKTRAYGNNEKRVVVTILFFIGLFSTLLLLIPSAAKAQNHPEESKNRKEKITFRVVSWNVENLFDCRHDTLKNDYEFLPDAMRHWNYSKYKQKLAHISRVIAAVGEWNPPALIGLCEVENDSVLNDLTRRSPLKELDYRYVITRSPDPRGIDVALLYQRDVFKLLSFRPVGIPPIQGHHPTRDLLHVSGQLLTGDTLDVFVCHLPSRSGGAKASEPYRLQAARILRQQADSIMHTRLHPQLIIMGDFNDYPYNASIRQVLEAEAPSYPLLPKKLYHLLASQSKTKSFGSYKFHGEWGLLDHLIVSGTLLDTSSHFFTKESYAHISRLPFLLTEDSKYGGKEPFRTYKGMKYNGGYSDHLPVYTDFELYY